MSHSFSHLSYLHIQLFPYLSPTPFLPTFRSSLSSIFTYLFTYLLTYFFSPFFPSYFSPFLIFHCSVLTLQVLCSHAARHLCQNIPLSTVEAATLLSSSPCKVRTYLRVCMYVCLYVYVHVYCTQTYTHTYRIFYIIVSAAGFGLLLACGVTALASYGVAYKYISPDFPTSVISDLLLLLIYCMCY